MMNKLLKCSTEQIRRATKEESPGAELLDSPMLDQLREDVQDPAKRTGAVGVEAEGIPPPEAWDHPDEDTLNVPADPFPVQAPATPEPPPAPSFPHPQPSPHHSPARSPHSEAQVISDDEGLNHTPPSPTPLPDLLFLSCLSPLLATARVPS